MGVIWRLFDGTPMPRVLRVRQRFPATEVADIGAAIQEELARPGVGDTVNLTTNLTNRPAAGQ